MVTSIIRLRISYLLSYLRGKPNTVLKRLALLVLGFVFAVFLAWFPTKINFETSELALNFDLLLATLIVTVLAVGPFFITRWNIDVRSFQTVPLTPAKLASTFIFTGALTWPFLWVFVWLSTWVFFRRDEIVVDILAISVFLITLLTVLVSARFFASLSEKLFNSSRKKKLRNFITVALLFVFLPISLSVFLSFSDVTEQEAIGELASFIGYTPQGLPFQVLQNLVLEQQLQALAGFFLTVTVFMIMTGLTFSAIIADLRSNSYPEEQSYAKTRLGWFEALPATPAGAIGARSIIYWLKDPRYRVSLFALPIIPFSVVAVLKFAGVSMTFLSFIPLPLVLIMIAWMAHNDVANDSTAFWLHVSSGVKGGQDRFGRLIPVFLLGIPILFIGTGLSVLISDDWQLAASFFSLGFVALCGSAAVSSVSSVLLPYPATRPDESPFTQPQWQGFGAGFAQTMTLVSSAILLAPIIWLIIADNINPSLNQQGILIGLSLGYGLFLLAIGLAVGGAIYNRRASHILTLMQVFD